MNVRGVVTGALSILGMLAGMALLAYVAAPHWAAVRAAGRGMSPLWVLAAALALSLHYAIAFGIWLACLRATGARATARQAADTYVPSLLARYVPGKVWSYGVRMAIARRAGMSMTEVTGAVGWEMLLALAGAGVVALAVTPGTAIDPRIRMATALFTLACFVMVAVVKLIASRPSAPSILRRLGLGGTAGAGFLARLGLAHLAGWLVYGVAHWCLARAITPIGMDAFPLVTGAVALAWIGGYLALITPAGLGVREGLLTVLLAPHLGAGPVLVLAGASRLLAISLEIALLLAWSSSRSGATAGARHRS